MIFFARYCRPSAWDYAEGISRGVVAHYSEVIGEGGEGRNH